MTVGRVGAGYLKGDNKIFLNLVQHCPAHMQDISANNVERGE